MKKSLLGLSVIAAVLVSACNSNNNTKPSEAQPVSGTNSTSQTTTTAKPVVTCVPVKSTKVETEVKAPAKEEPASTASNSKNKTSKSKTTAKKPAAKPATTTASASSSSTSTSAASTKPATAPTGPVSPNADGTCPAGTEAVVTQPAAKPATTAATTTTSSKEPPVRTVKSKDGSFDGEVHGTPAAGSKLAKIQIGMSQYEVEKLIGYPDDVRSYLTGKAFIPFYFGSDSSRTEWVYRGYGSVAFDSGHGRGVVMMINHDAKIQ